MSINKREDNISFLITANSLNVNGYLHSKLEMVHISLLCKQESKTALPLLCDASAEDEDEDIYYSSVLSSFNFI